MVRQVIVQEDGSVFIQDWAMWQESAGSSRTWSKDDWNGEIGDVFRAFHQRRTSRDGGRVTFWVEV